MAKGPWLLEAPQHLWDRLRNRLVLSTFGVMLISLASFTGLSLLQQRHLMKQRHIERALILFTALKRELAREPNPELLSRRAVAHVLAKYSSSDFLLEAQTPSLGTVHPEEQVFSSEQLSLLKSIKNPPIGNPIFVTGPEGTSFLSGGTTLTVLGPGAHLHLLQNVNLDMQSLRKQTIDQVIISLLALWMALLLIGILVERQVKPLADLRRFSEQIFTDVLPGEPPSVGNAAIEIRDLRNSFAQLLASLRANDERKMTFVSMVSHELKQPLTIMQGSLSSILMREPDLAPKLRARLVMTQQETLRMASLLNDLLDLTRGGLGKLELQLTPVFIGKLLQDVVSMAQESRPGKITLECNFEENQSLILLADEARLKQVLMNLLSNACKYSDSESKIIINALQDGPYLKLEILDSGIGISEYEAQRIFSSFERGLRTEGIEGSGLGLAVSKMLVEQMGGSIGAEPRQEKGSRFWIKLPLTTIHDI
jgi:signal transduction histidine kinase